MAIRAPYQKDSNFQYQARNDFVFDSRTFPFFWRTFCDWTIKKVSDEVEFKSFIAWGKKLLSLHRATEQISEISA